MILHWVLLCLNSPTRSHQGAAHTDLLSPLFRKCKLFDFVHYFVINKGSKQTHPFPLPFSSIQWDSEVSGNKRFSLIICSLKNATLGHAVVVHTFNPSIWVAEAGRFEFEASLVYRVSSRTARATQRGPVSKEKRKNREKKKRKMQFCTYIATKIPSGVIESDVLC